MLRRSLTILAALATVVTRPAAAPAQVGCGATIGPGAKVTLTADIGPCDAVTDPALRVVGPATLDMAGHRLFCDEASRPGGLLVEGKGAKILRGSATDCVYGLFLDGDGGHKVEDFASYANADEGVQINSDKNKLTRVVGNDNGDDGFDVEGDKNKLQETDAVGNGDNGYELDGDQTKLQRITAIRNGNHGLFLGGERIKVKDCVVAGNTEDGMHVPGNDNKIEKCLVTRNGEGNDPGINLAGDRTQVKKNIVMDNNPDGINVEDGADTSKVQNNVVLGNDGVDLRDGNAGGTCDGNQWKKNVFGTSEADGVPSPGCIR
jgi:Right handed beta helix region